LTAFYLKVGGLVPSVGEHTSWTPPPPQQQSCPPLSPPTPSSQTHPYPSRSTPCPSTPLAPLLPPPPESPFNINHSLDRLGTTGGNFVRVHKVGFLVQFPHSHKKKDENIASLPWFKRFFESRVVSVIELATTRNPLGTQRPLPATTAGPEKCSNQKRIAAIYRF
jgi:hypothetical protein